MDACAAPGFGLGGVPVLAVGQDVQQAAGVFHVIRVAGCDGFPGVAGGVGGGLAEGGQQPVLPVGAVVGEGFAGPFAGDQDPVARVAEVFAAVGFAFARAGGQAGSGVFGLDAVAEPVGASWRARSYRSASASRSACACWASLVAWWQSATCLVRYLVR